MSLKSTQTHVVETLNGSLACTKYKLYTCIYFICKKINLKKIVQPMTGKLFHTMSMSYNEQSQQ